MENIDIVNSGLPKNSSLKPFNPPTSRINVSNAERWVSIAGGVLLTYAGVKDKDPKFFSLLGPATYLFFRGVTGFCPLKNLLKKNSVNQDKDISVSIFQKVTINKPVEEVYEFWKNFENLPTVMEHVFEIKQVEGRTSRWKVKIPMMNMEFSWDAVMVEDIKKEKITWRSLEGSEIMNAGEVRFRMVNSTRTEVQVSFNYAPPMGYTGKVLAGLVSPWFSKMIRADIKRVKSYLETGTTDQRKSERKHKKRTKDTQSI